MKATNLFLTAVAAIALAAYPTLSINASTPPAQTTATDSVNVNADPDKAASKPKVKVAIKGMSVNGRPATEEEKAVAKDMIRKGVQRNGSRLISICQCWRHSEYTGNMVYIDN